MENLTPERMESLRLAMNDNLDAVVALFELGRATWEHDIAAIPNIKERLRMSIGANEDELALLLWIRYKEAWENPFGRYTGAHTEE